VDNEGVARRREVEHFFDEYVVWMRNDIARELSWVRTVRPRSRREWIVRVVLRRGPRGAGNLLCALGLLVYTEALGRVWRWNFERAEFFNTEDPERPRERPRKNFEAAFDRLDAGAYGRWRKDWQKEHKMMLYEVLRSGLVHEYRPKIPAKVHLGYDQPRGVDYVDDRLSFYVVPYHRHFCALADELRGEIMAAADPSLPEPYLARPAPIKLAGDPGSTSGSTG
jgi:hypothetical protein